MVMTEQCPRIAFNTKVADDTFLMGLECPSIVKQGKPGQFVMIRVSPGTDPLLRRPFSICGARGEDTVLVLYRVVGRGTELMSRFLPGQGVPVLGPLGRGFDLPKTGGRSLLVAGGIGLAPLAFLAGSLKLEEVKMAAGFATAGEAVPWDRLGLEGLKVSVAPDDGTLGHHGLVTELMETILDGDPEISTSVFACGPHAMLRRVSAIARDRGVRCQVSLEAHMACGVGACQGCALKAASGGRRPYLHVCQDGPVFDARDLDWEV
jgi:dihydroorotate dehydrogenase electron transfer subunit